ncbi:hypothetical protein TWF217_007530 [Orbilia oligospora]|nr:hypothetical protein TWF217_007530 [Orbilia oligospora]
MRSLRTSGYQNGSWTLHAPCHERLVTWRTCMLHKKPSPCWSSGTETMIAQQREDATIFLSACTPLELLFAPQDQLHILPRILKRSVSSRGYITIIQPTHCHTARLPEYLGIFCIHLQQKLFRSAWLNNPATTLESLFI